MLKHLGIGFVLVLVVALLLPQHSHAQGDCAFCNVIILKDAPKCCRCSFCAAYSSGCNCDIDLNCQNGAECVYCGCCNYIPGTGGVCYDNTGGACGRESCSEGTTSTRPITKLLNVDSRDEITRLFAFQTGTEQSSSKSAELLSSSPWIADTSFQQKIADLAPQLGVLLHNYQTHYKKNERVHYVEGHTIDGKILIDNISYKFITTKSGENWRLEIQPDPDDPDSAHAPILAKDVPNAIEILGHHWKLIHHIHGRETTEKIIATGSI